MSPKALAATLTLGLALALTLWWGLRDSGLATTSQVAPFAPTTVAITAPTSEPTAVPAPTASPEPTAVLEPTTPPEPATVLEPTTPPEPTAVLQPTTPPEPTAVLQPTTPPEPTPTAVPRPTDPPLPEPSEVPEAAPLADGSSIVGTLTSNGNAHVRAFVVQVSQAQDDQSPGALVDSVEVDAVGSFSFSIPAGCYVLTFVAPERSIMSNGERLANRSVCTQDGQEPVVLNETAFDAPILDSQVSGSVSSQALGFGIANVAVELFESVDGVSGALVASTATNTDGDYQLMVQARCYIVRLTAPAQRTFIGSGQLLSSSEVCIDAQTPAVFNGELAG